MKQILSFAKTYVILVILFVAQKPLFSSFGKVFYRLSNNKYLGLYASGNLAWVVA